MINNKVRKDMTNHGNKIQPNPNQELQSNRITNTLKSTWKSLNYWEENPSQQGQAKQTYQ